MSRVLVLVPLKPWGRAKSRLGSRYDAASRARIAEARARRVLASLERAFPDADRAIVGEDSLTEFARETNVRLIPEPEGASLGEKLDATLESEVWDVAFVVMGDLPDVDPDDLRTLAAVDGDVVLAEGVDGVGTNAIRLAHPRGIRLAFAEPSSCDVHESRAPEAGHSAGRSGRL